MTENELKRRFPYASAAFIRANATGCAHFPTGLRAPEPEPDPRVPLDSALPGEKESSRLPRKGAFVCFHIYTTHPRDWDNTFTKPCQDLLVEVGLLAADDSDSLQGIVIPHKVKSKKAQRTEIEIWYA